MTGIHQLLFSNFITAVAGADSFVVVETFNGSTTWTCPTGVTSVDYLVVAGGGGGGVHDGAAGAGGAGGFRTGTGMPVTAGTDYSITVGAGGSTVTPYSSSTPKSFGDNGENSVFNTITSTGGGGGGGGGGGVAAGQNGGSGGGG